VFSVAFCSVGRRSASCTMLLIYCSVFLLHHVGCGGCCFLLPRVGSGYCQSSASGMENWITFLI